MKKFIIVIILILLIFISFQQDEGERIDDAFDYIFQALKGNDLAIKKLVMIGDYILELKKIILRLQDNNDALIEQINRDKELIKDLQNQIELYKIQLSKSNEMLLEIKDYINKNYFYRYSFFVSMISDFNKVYINIMFANYYTILGIGMSYDIETEKILPLLTIGIRLNF